MRILVVSGFLGAGKTTFIKELAHRTREDFSVMENEYGQVGIDGQLLAEKEMPESGEEDAGKLNIWELTEGCICCSMKSDFASSILTIANTIDPEYLIVEPTGVGMLSNVMSNIRLIQYERISLLSPITILDGNSFDRYCQEFPDIYRDQIASAGWRPGFQDGGGGPGRRWSSWSKASARSTRTRRFSPPTTPPIPIPGGKACCRVRRTPLKSCPAKQKRRICKISA